MTENEKYLEMPWNIEDTIENLKIIKEHFIATVLKTNLDGKGKQDAKEVEFDFNRAIQALEEIQQYRAIGTIEEFKALKEKQYNCTIKNLTNECSYKETGCSDCKGYWEIRKLLEKNVAKKSKEVHENEVCIDFICPNCKEAVYGQPYRPNYCKHCGQKLDWQ